MRCPASPPQSGPGPWTQKGEPTAVSLLASGSGPWARSTDITGTPREVVGIPVRAARAPQPILQQLGDPVARRRRGLDRYRVAAGHHVGDADGDDAQRQPDPQAGMLDRPRAGADPGTGLPL